MSCAPCASIWPFSVMAAFRSTVLDSILRRCTALSPVSSLFCSSGPISPAARHFFSPAASSTPQHRDGTANHRVYLLFFFSPQQPLSLFTFGIYSGDGPNLSDALLKGSSNLPAPHARCVEQTFMFLSLRVSSRIHNFEHERTEGEALSAARNVHGHIRSSAALRFGPVHMAKPGAAFPFRDVNPLPPL